MMHLLMIGTLAWAAPDSGAASQPAALDTLSRRIIEKQSSVDFATRLTSEMSAAATGLMERFDAGDETQAMQQRVVEEIEDAIRFAEQQQPKGKSRASASQPSGRPRQKRPPPAPNRSAGARRSASVQQPAERESDSGGAPGAVERQGLLRELRAGWGHLPEREREELLQGIQETSLPRYREWVERYFRTLAQPDEERPDSAGESP